MDYAVNKLTNKRETADQATRSGLYVCPFCQKRVGLRSGPSRKEYFAHWPGVSSTACEYFTSGMYEHIVDANALAPQSKRLMDLRLMIQKGENRAAWSIDLVLPSCRSCHAFVIVDVGGRLQKINMRGMGTGFRVMAELSVENFRIVSYDGKPDPHFVASVERECPGLPLTGAAVFTASGRGEIRGFPRAQELRGSETYALLWTEPAAPDFPDELVLNRFKARQGWNLILVTLPEKPSAECEQWLLSFTGLIVNPPVPSLTTIWPFLTRNSSINTVEYVESTSVLLSAHMIPTGQQSRGPTLQVFGGNERISAEATDHSPALFALMPEKSEHFRVGKAEYPDIEKFFSRNPSLGRSHSMPMVELAFTDREGKRLIIPFHERKCQAFVMAARAQELTFDYLAMPPGTKGRLQAELPSGHRQIKQLKSGEELAVHNQHQRRLTPDMHALLAGCLTDPTCQLDLNFGGFGCLRIIGERTATTGAPLSLTLAPSLRFRLRCFMSQLQVSVPIPHSANDHTLVRAFSVMKPQPELISNYRTLAKDVLACGFDVKFLEEGVSP